MSDKTIRLTTAQAIVKYLDNQFIEIEGKETRICGGGFGIFGHGNVKACPSIAAKMSNPWDLQPRDTPNITCESVSCSARPLRVRAPRTC